MPGAGSSATACSMPVTFASSLSWMVLSELNSVATLSTEAFISFDRSPALFASVMALSACSVNFLSAAVSFAVTSSSSCSMVLLMRMNSY
ncbi:hypothetical protein D3C87_1393130 [compost metagenome]